MVQVFTLLEIDRPADATVREWRTIARGAHESMGSRWATRYFRRHFTAGAKFLYGHAPRTQRYLRFKRALYGAGKAVQADVDNLLTGKLRAQLRSSMSVRGFPTRATVRAESLVYAPARVRRARGPHKIRELFRVIPAEAVDLAGHLHEQFHRRIRQLRTVKRFTQ